MRVSTLMQFNTNKVVFLFLSILALLYFLGYFLLIKTNNIVFNKPVIFENAYEIESVLKDIFTEGDGNKQGLKAVYFWKPYCPCNLGVGPHYTELVKEYKEQGVDFYIIDLSGNPQSDYVPDGEVLPAEVTQKLSTYIEYAPAIAILNGNNDLLYYGPHNLGFVCNAETSIASQVITSFKEGIFSKNINVLGEGCFCRT